VHPPALPAGDELDPGERADQRDVDHRRGQPREHGTGLVIDEDDHGDGAAGHRRKDDARGANSSVSRRGG
jgi:hypothetical protein